MRYLNRLCTVYFVYLRRVWYAYTSWYTVYLYISGQRRNLIQQTGRGTTPGEVSYRKLPGNFQVFIYEIWNVTWYIVFSTVGPKDSFAKYVVKTKYSSRSKPAIEWKDARDAGRAFIWSAFENESALNVVGCSLEGMFFGFSCVDGGSWTQAASVLDSFWWSIKVSKRHPLVVFEPCPVVSCHICRMAF